MNKKLFGLIFVFAFLAIFNINNAVSAANLNISLTTTSISSNSVTLKATGSLDAGPYEFSIYDVQNSSLGEVLVESKVSEVINSAKDRVILFSGLKSFNNYIAKVKVNDVTYSTRFMTLKSTSSLDGLIKQANDLIDKAVEGINAGQYRSGSKAIFSKAISDAEYLSGNISIYTQSDINNAVRDLEAAMNTFELAKIVGSSTSTSSSTRDTFTGGIVPKCNTGEIDKVTGQYKTPCNFSFFMDLINRIIKFALFVIATPLVALIIMYTGYLYLTAGGSAGQTEKAKHILLSVVVGYMIALGAWIIVNTIMSAFKVDPSINTFLEK